MSNTPNFDELQRCQDAYENALRALLKCIERNFPHGMPHPSIPGAYVSSHYGAPPASVASRTLPGHVRINIPNEHYGSAYNTNRYHWKSFLKG